MFDSIKNTIVNNAIDNNVKCNIAPTFKNLSFIFGADIAKTSANTNERINAVI